MKIRNGLVTNSSSSSFVMIKTKNKKLLELMKKYEDCFDNAYIDDCNEEITISEDEGCIEIVDDVNRIMETLITYFSTEIYFENETKEEILDDLENYPFAKELYLNREEIMEIWKV